MYSYILHFVNRISVVMSNVLEQKKNNLNTSSPGPYSVHSREFELYDWQYSLEGVSDEDEQYSNAESLEGEQETKLRSCACITSERYFKSIRMLFIFNCASAARAGEKFITVFAKLSKRISTGCFLFLFLISVTKLVRIFFRFSQLFCIVSTVGFSQTFFFSWGFFGVGTIWSSWARGTFTAAFLDWSPVVWFSIIGWVVSKK